MILERNRCGNGDFFTGSAEGNRLMNKRQFYHRVISGVRMDAQTPASWSHTRVKTLACVLG